MYLCLLGPPDRKEVSQRRNYLAYKQNLEQKWESQNLLDLKNKSFTCLIPPTGRRVSKEEMALGKNIKSRHDCKVFYEDLRRTSGGAS